MTCILSGPEPRRWVVERDPGPDHLHQGTARDYERLTEHHETIIYWAMIITIRSRLAGHQQPAPPRAVSSPDRL